MSVSSAAFRVDDVRVVATIEARMTSSRLPGKVLADVGGLPALAMMVSRLERAQTLDAICLATTTNTDDDPLAAMAEDLGILVWRGSEDDVLGRVVEAAAHAAADVVVETTGDCPMIDPVVVDACVLSYFATDVHYCSNNLERTFPRGLDTQVFAADLLAEVERTTDDPADREHVSLYIYEHPEQHRLLTLRAPAALHRPSYRWTVDTAEDLEFVRQVVGTLGHAFSAREAVDLCDAEPALVAVNAHVEQKAVR